MNPVILDGRALARLRAPELRGRAGVVSRIRGRAPSLVLIAFEGDDGRAPWLAGKLRAARTAGISLRPLRLAAGLSTDQACDQIYETLENSRPDAVYLQFPFPAELDVAALSAAVPPSLDIDCIHPESCRRYLSDGVGPPPVTVAGALALIGHANLVITGARSLIIGGSTPFNQMFCAALGRATRRQCEIVDLPPSALETPPDAALVVVSNGLPSGLSARGLKPGTIAIDAGYFNAGGRGNIDVSDGVSHLKALAPVPGGLGPISVSVLMEAVITRAEAEVRPS